MKLRTPHTWSIRLLAIAVGIALGVMGSLAATAHGSDRSHDHSGRTHSMNLMVQQLEDCCDKTGLVSSSVSGPCQLAVVLAPCAIKLHVPARLGQMVPMEDQHLTSWARPIDLRPPIG
jgi:hypothetical protein